MMRIEWAEPTPARNFDPGPAEPASTIQQIIRETAVKYQVSVRELLSDRRHRYLAWPRQEIMWRCKEETYLSLPQIGRVLRRDHTTIIHGIKRHQKRLDQEREAQSLGLVA